MELPVSLKYPNGRMHHAVVNTPGGLIPGTEFDLHGRRWRAVGFVSNQGRMGGTPRMLCETAGDTAPLRASQRQSA